LETLTEQLEQQGLFPAGADPLLVQREDLVKRRLQHLESIIEAQVAHICTLRESVQRIAGAFVFGDCRGTYIKATTQLAFGLTQSPDVGITGVPCTQACILGMLVGFYVATNGVSEDATT
jgi:hypothetical protein